MNATSVSSNRRYDIDWLRVLLILTVFVFHSLRFFDLDGWHVKNASTYLGVQVVIVFLSRWMMPLIFLISGAATYYALNKGAGRFIKDRSLRLLVPLLVGLFTHVPLQVYLEQVGQQGYRGSFWQWYPSMFDGLMLLGGTFNWIGNHLWYLEALFIFSIITLPLLLWLRHGSGQRVMAWLRERLSAPWTVYLLALPTLLLIYALNPDSANILTNEGFGGWNLPNYMVFFLAGFLIISSERLQANIRRLRWVSLVAGIVVFVVGIPLAIAFDEPPYGAPAYFLLMTLSALGGWTWILIILGFGLGRLNVHNPALDYANEAVLPFYVMHQTVLLVVGFFVVNWAIPDLAKWAIIAAGSFGIIMGLYELLVRRINLLRVLFGMKPVYQAKTVQEPAAQVS